jgi:hypothetical protein
MPCTATLNDITNQETRLQMKKRTPKILKEKPNFSWIQHALEKRKAKLKCELDEGRSERNPNQKDVPWMIGCTRR